MLCRDALRFSVLAANWWLVRAAGKVCVERQERGVIFLAGDMGLLVMTIMIMISLFMTMIEKAIYAGKTCPTFQANLTRTTMIKTETF